MVALSATLTMERNKLKSVLHSMSAALQKSIVESAGKVLVVFGRHRAGTRWMK